jgi:hypothetical protein
MLALDLVERVAERLQKVVVGVEHDAVEGELDHGLRLADRRDLTFEVGGLGLLRGDVGRELHHLVGLAVPAHHRIVGGLDPDLAAAFGESLVLGGLERAGAQAGSEVAIFGALPVGRLDEHRVMLADDLRQRVADCAEEVLVGRQDVAVEIELDDRLDPVEGGELCLDLVVFLDENMGTLTFEG